MSADTARSNASTVSRRAASLLHPIEERQLFTGDVVQLSQQVPLKGRNVSGRSWKVRPQKRASTLIKSKVNGAVKDWSARTAEKLARQEAKQLQQELSESKRQSILQKKERRLENEKRRAENELKTMEKSAQTLNFNRVGQTLKAMSKKQLRQVKKTRLNPKTGVVEYVSAYAK